ncbi:MAG: ATP-dependent Clp protease ATP-binding subunit, partial [Epsilonproteobacteria bacterium]|nr:ATP-dependent Clp protease ATP-binding subunit [Campylobacterota bacterium]
FLNRLDDIVIFNPLGEQEIVKIVDIMFRKIEEKLKERDIKIELTPSAKKLIARAGFDPVYGARPLKRALYELVEDRLAELILEDKVKEGDRVRFDAEGDEIVVYVNDQKV